MFPLLVTMSDVMKMDLGQHQCFLPWFYYFSVEIFGGISITRLIGHLNSSSGNLATVFPSNNHILTVALVKRNLKMYKYYFFDLIWIQHKAVHWSNNSVPLIPLLYKYIHTDILFFSLTLRRWHSHVWGLSFHCSHWLHFDLAIVFNILICVCMYDCHPRGLGSIPSRIRSFNSYLGFGTGSTKPREYNWVAAWYEK